MTNPAIDRGHNNPESAQPEAITWRHIFQFSTDHKVIGVQYIITTFIFF